MKIEQMAAVQIYQLMVRHFGNTNVSRVWNGTIEQNGCGKFNDISSTALAELKKMGYTHIWYTGILEHATGSSYEGIAADPECLLKGKAGSPYAVRDYFDVSADLAESVPNRTQEFKELLDRTRAAGMEAIIDFIPNHVARSYASDVRPVVNFGNGDDPSKFFHEDNNFYYLGGKGQIVLPDGVFEPEILGRVTGNNAITWMPSKHDWYETVKLNYGFDFRKGNDTSGLLERTQTPDTWFKMDAVIAYWQELGVRGFRCDMAHMVPLEFWQWAIGRARGRDAKVYFTGEAYDLDPAKLSEENILHDLMDVGFDSVYDSESYDIVKGIYEDGKWANDIDEVLWDERRLHQMLRYVENHDEVRVASPQHWGAHGAKVGRPATAILFGIGRAATMIYNGQEVAEPAIGSEGFCGDDGRTTIFDYWGVPELQKWVNKRAYDGGELSEDQRELRQWYSDWVNLMHEPAFSEGEVYGLNGVNLTNPDYGRVDGETYSGHWLYSFLRYTDEQSYLVVVNLHPDRALENVKIDFPAEVWESTAGHEMWQIDTLDPASVVTYQFV